MNRRSQAVPVFNLFADTLHATVLDDFKTQDSLTAAQPFLYLMLYWIPRQHALGVGHPPPSASLPTSMITYNTAHTLTCCSTTCCIGVAKSGKAAVSRTEVLVMFVASRVGGRAQVVAESSAGELECTLLRVTTCMCGIIYVVGWRGESHNIS